MAVPMARLGLKSGLDIFCIVPAYKIMHAQNMKCLVSKYNLTFAKQTRMVFMTVLPNNREINWQKQSENSEFDRRINSRFSYVINMADFCSSLQWTSMGDIDIFAFISQ